MTSSDDTGSDQLSPVVPSFGPKSRYDLVLAVIPLLFGLALVSHTLLSVSLSATMAASSVVAGLLVVDALFRNPPGIPPSGAG